MGTAADVLQLTESAPVWLSLSVVVLSFVARAVLARVASARRQGSRIGRLEAAFATEVIRRRQLEHSLREAGADVPWWPGDPDHLPPRDVDEDQVDADTYQLPTQDFTRHRLRRNHR